MCDVMFVVRHATLYAAALADFPLRQSLTILHMPGPPPGCVLQYSTTGERGGGSIYMMRSGHAYFDDRSCFHSTFQARRPPIPHMYSCVRVESNYSAA